MCEVSERTHMDKHRDISQVLVLPGSERAFAKQSRKSQRSSSLVQTILYVWGVREDTHVFFRFFRSAGRPDRDISQVLVLPGSERAFAKQSRKSQRPSKISYVPQDHWQLPPISLSNFKVEISSSLFITIENSFRKGVTVMWLSYNEALYLHITYLFLYIGNVFRPQ